MSEITKTKKYEIFKKHENNREINQASLKTLISSIKTNNMLMFRPILVDTKMRILDGQHRLEAAKALGLEVYYQIKYDASHEDIVLINNQRRWEMSDYINYYSSLGNEHYIKVKSLCDELQMNLRDVLSCLNKSSGGRLSSDIKSGAFQYITEEEEVEVKKLILTRDSILNEMRRFVLSYPKCVDSFRMKSALVAMLKNPQCDPTVLAAKVRIKSDSIKPCVSVFSYYTMLREIYNWKNQNPME